MTGGPASDMMGLVICTATKMDTEQGVSDRYIREKRGDRSGAPRSARNTRQVSHLQPTVRRDPRRVTAPVYRPYRRRPSSHSLFYASSILAMAALLPRHEGHSGMDMDMGHGSASMAGMYVPSPHPSITC